ncbi:MAG TPA: DNA-directed RNA polymerase subunit alpha [Acidobacteria bacterium]|nr:DNA-directed RNA polymerase subunit alpha [Acidobacteriota bacterium]
MRSPLFLSLPLLLLAPCAAASASEPGTLARIEVSNPSGIARPDTLVRLSFEQLGVTAGPLQVWEGDAARPTQLLDGDGDGRPDALAFLADLGAAATHGYVVDRRPAASAVPQRTHAEVSIKEGGAWQGKVYVGGTFRSVRQVTMPPQASDHNEYLRYEGPGIESDQVGYRVYLDWRNGFDIFGKKTSAMVLPHVGLDGYESYHQMADWGADILKVGQSLGMGGFGYWDIQGKKAVLVSDVAERSVRIGSDGPIHSSFVLAYKGWKTGAATADLSATLSMQAGSPMVDVALETSVTSGRLDNLAVGLVIHPEAEVMTGDLDVTGEAWSYLATFGKQTLFGGVEGDRLGMVLLFRKMDLVEQTRDEASQVLVLRPRGTKLSYAFGALWSGQKGGVQTREELKAFLEAEVERRTLAPRIRLKTEASRAARELSPLQVSTRLGTSEMARRGDSLSVGGWDSFASRPSNWNYTTGLLMQAMDDLAAAAGDPRFSDFARRTIDSYLTPDGAIRTFDAGEFNIDSINSGKMLQRLWQRHRDPKYRAAIGALAAQLAEHPRTSEGAFWHKQRYPHQLWLDGVYMGMPFLAGVGVAEGDDHKVEEAVREFTIARAHLRDPRSGLYYHAWDEAGKQNWADPQTGRSRYVWGRGLGWYAMALVDILDVIPPERAALRQPLLAMIPELAESLVRHQDATGVWYQILDLPAEPGNYREASATAMFTYFLAKAVNKGYLPASFAPAARKAWAGLVDEFVSVHADGSYHLTNVVEVGGLGYGRDGSYRYYMSERVVENDPKGLGPAIMAGIQVAQLAASPGAHP